MAVLTTFGISQLVSEQRVTTVSKESALVSRESVVGVAQTALDLCVELRVSRVRTNIARDATRDFILDAADVRESDGDLAVARRYRNDAERIKDAPPLDCSRQQKDLDAAKNALEQEREED